MYLSYELKEQDKGRFTVFVQDSKNKQIYYGFEIGFEKDTSDSVYSSQYRLQKANVYKFNDSIMIDQGIAVLTKGESEFVYKTSGKLDFSGGFHGNEQLINISFFVDNNVLNLEKSFNLMHCNSFKYVQKSTIHESASITNGINKDHPIESIHTKTTSFGDSGYETTNKIEWEKNLKLDEVYGSLVCLSTDFGGFGKSNSIDTVKFDTKGGYKLESKDKSMIIWNTKNNTKAFIESNFSIFDNTSTQRIWDHETYNKYYRGTGKVYTNINDTWIFQTKVKFNIDFKETHHQ